MAVMILVILAIERLAPALRAQMTRPSASESRPAFIVTFGRAAVETPRAEAVRPSTMSVPRPLPIAPAGRTSKHARTALSRPAVNRWGLLVDKRVSGYIPVLRELRDGSATPSDRCAPVWRIRIWQCTTTAPDDVASVPGRERPMEYPRFERLVIGGTTAFVLLTLVAAIVTSGPDPAEIVGQMAVIFVMVAAVHWGRRVGTLAAFAACLLYLGVRMPLLAAEPTGNALLLIISRFAGYCLIGMVGGEIFARVKYMFASQNRSGVIDDWSQVYNQRYAARALEQALARHRRYQEPYSVVVVRLEPAVTGTQAPPKLRGVVRTVASFLRDDVRLADDVARLDDGRFVVMLPHTPGKAAPAVAERVRTGICNELGAKDDCVTTTCLGTDLDIAALEQFAASITPGENAVRDQPASGA